MKGFKKHATRGPKMGHSFSSKAGFSGSTGRTQEIRSYTRGVPGKKAFAEGGMVVVKGTDGGSSLTRRAKPVTSADAEAGGKGPLRPGFNKGGKACYAEGGKVGGLGEAIRMVKVLMAQGNSAETAASKAARRYNVPAQSLKNPGAATGGGGLSSDKQLLARGGLSKAIQRTANKVANVAIPAAQGQKGPPMQQAPNAMGRAARGVVGRSMGQAPLSQMQAPPSAMGRAAQGVASQAVSPQQPVMGNHGYGSFGRRPVIG